MNKKLTVDFSEITTSAKLHEKMKEIFGFPDFYGKNTDALIDCLTSLRSPEDGMTSFHISQDQQIVLELINIDYSNSQNEIAEELFASIQFVNYRCVLMNEPPSILLLLTKDRH